MGAPSKRDPPLHPSSKQSMASSAAAHNTGSVNGSGLGCHKSPSKTQQKRVRQQVQVWLRKCNLLCLPLMHASVSHDHGVLCRQHPVKLSLVLPVTDARVRHATCGDGLQPVTQRLLS